MNLQFHYLYRDGDNYKNRGTTILQGCPENLNEWESQLKETLEDESHFIASQVQLDEVFHYKQGYPVDNSDHSWHEYNSIETTEEEPEPNARTPEEFLQDFQNAKAAGWEIFEPKDQATA